MELLQYDPSKLSFQVKMRPGKKLEIDPTKERPFSIHFTPDSKRWWKKGIQPQRDSYQKKCYKAEHDFTEKIEQKKFANISEVAKYVREFMEKPWFQHRFPQFQQCRVEYEPGTRRCYGGPHVVTADGREVVYGGITLSSWGMGTKPGRGGEIVVLHELAHAVLPNGHHHDRRWVRTFIEFVGCAMGQTVKKILMECFREYHVPFSPVKTVKFSAERIKTLAASRPIREKNRGKEKETSSPQQG